MRRASGAHAREPGFGPLGELGAVAHQIQSHIVARRLSCISTEIVSVQIFGRKD